MKTYITSKQHYPSICLNRMNKNVRELRLAGKYTGLRMEPDTHQALSLHQPAQALKQFFSIFLDGPQAHRDRYQHAKHAPGEILTRDPTVRAAYSRALKKRAVEYNLNTCQLCEVLHLCRRFQCSNVSRTPIFNKIPMCF
jgi:hypothetical protein